LNTSGEIIVVYDAEDRPAPDQPKRAVARLIESGAAVVQGVLACDHDGPLIARLWAHEYSVLFLGVLPLLSRLGVPFLLGGTSQFLRRDALMAVGAFDAHNTAEDADLAVRLARAGYTSSVVLSVTGEEAPLEIRAWVKQRSRWIKGWLQTVLVHGLLPRAIDRWTPPMRLRDRIALAIQLPVQLLCLASHPVGMAVAFNDPHGPLAVLLFTGYALTIVVFMVAAIRAGRSPWDAFALPLYSFLHTVAMVIAVVELVTAPDYWSKTEHGLVRNRPRLSGPS
jgi:cellulose synthase/poly-beta-1,6-N-acetylglucosamine synthase-like glycosyltransferase